MAQDSLDHKTKKDSTAKWFVFVLIPILNLYWLWKAAEVVSGHEIGIYESHESVKHLERKDSTGKWFGIFFMPVIVGLIAGFGAIGAFAIGAASAGFTLLILLGVIAFIAGIYMLYKMAESVSGHETVYPGEHETVGHKKSKDSTGKWVVFGIIPILNLYFLWKMSETISGHEKIVGRPKTKKPEKGSRKTSEKVRYCTNCGNELDDDAKFCPECGAEI